MGNKYKEKSSTESPIGTTSRISFRGSFEHNIDDKGRVSIPSSFRSAVSQEHIQSVILTNFVCDGARCLEGFALSDWEVFEEKLKKRNHFDSQLRKLENFYLARAVECPLDSNGRITIPSNLRTYANLQRELVFTSSFHGFRIWDKRVWELIFSEAESALMDNPDIFIDVDR